MDVSWINRDCTGDPADVFACLGERAPAVLAIAGDPAILREHRTGLLCSRSCPGDLILRAYDVASGLRDSGRTVVSGFHSGMEAECFRILLRGEQPIIICPARSIENMRVKPDWREPLAEGRLLVLSPFGRKHRRVTAPLAERRNELVAALADRVFVPYAEPGGKTEALCRRIVSWNTPLLTFDAGHNDNLLSMGARAVDASLD